MFRGVFGDPRWGTKTGLFFNVGVTPPPPASLPTTIILELEQGFGLRVDQMRRNFRNQIQLPQNTVMVGLGMLGFAGWVVLESPTQLVVDVDHSKP